jgi:hypothetical protein
MPATVRARKPARRGREFLVKRVLASDRQGNRAPVTDLKPRSTDPSDDQTADARVAEAIARIAAQGYPGRFEVNVGRVWCASCHSNVATKDVRWRVLEVVSGAVEVTVVGGIRCPICHEFGTAATALDLATN